VNNVAIQVQQEGSHINSGSARRVGEVLGTVTCSRGILFVRRTSIELHSLDLTPFCTECSELEPIEYHDHHDAQISGEGKK
jgi:hypothetical protein